MKQYRICEKAIFVILFFATIIYTILAIVYFPVEKQQTRNIFRFYTENWTYKAEDGTEYPIDIPGKVDVPKGNTYEVYNVVPQVEDDDMYMIFRGARQDLAVYIDGNLRASFSTKDTRFFGKYTPTYYLLVDLYKEDSGKTITVVYQADNRNSGSVGEVYYANQSGFLDYEFRLQGGVFILGIIMLIVSAITLVISIVISTGYKREISLTSISFAIFGVSIWILSNSVFRQYFAQNISAISDISFMVLPLIMAAYASYTNQVTKFRYKILFGIISGASLMVSVISTLLHILRIVDYMDSFWATGVVFVLLLAGVIYTLIMDTIHKKIKEYIVTAIALMIAGGCMLVQMIIYIRGGKAYDVSVAALGLFVMLILSAIETVRDVYRTYQDRDRAKFANDAKSQFLAKMSHEIRTPINAILGMNTMVLRNTKDEEILGYANNIKSASNNLLTIVNDILDFSKIESGKMELVPVKYDISSVINDVYNMIQTKASEKGLDFEMEIAEDIPCGYFGDDVRIRQILVNLLTNAVKYTPAGKVCLKISKNEDIVNKDSVNKDSVNKELQEKQNPQKGISKEKSQSTDDSQEKKVSLHFVVQDSGIGIKPEDISKLTEEFVRIEEARNRNIEGTGLGINIVASLLHMMQSKLEVHSVYGEGSVFFFDLTQPVTNEEPIGKISKRIQEQAAVREEYHTKLCIPEVHLLVVDDNRINRLVFKNLLKDLKCKVDEAESGIQCLELVKKNKYDIIFMDHMMPEMDGVETFQHMQELGAYLNASTPVVILTANAINGAKEDYLALGFDDYLSKPVDADALERMIDRIIPDEKKQKVEEKPKNLTEALPVIEGMDWDMAMKNLKTREALTETLQLFSQSAKQDVITLKSLYDQLLDEESDFIEFCVKVHAMKTSAATIGAVHVSVLAKYLEYAAKDRDLQTIHHLFNLFAREWLSLKAAIDKVLG